MRIDGPYEIYDPVEIPGWGQVKGHVIHDEITVARYDFNLNPVYGLRHLPTLEDGIKAKRFGWRTEMAMDLVLQIKRATALLGSFNGSKREKNSDHNHHSADHNVVDRSPEQISWAS